MEEQKESQLQIQQLTNKIKMLQMSSLDVNKYEDWKWEEILQWIMNMDDSRFRKYESDLTNNLSVEQPSGANLKEVNEGDIRRWGVTRFSDIKILSYNIKQLVDRNANVHDNVASVANEEGAVSGGYYK